MSKSGRPGRQPAGADARRLSYANVVATLALVLVVGGGTAWAAHHYLITSTSQIKPSVLKKLHGKNGVDGTNGTNGKNGKDGAVAGYFAQTKAATSFAGTTNTSIVTKNLPAGNYVLAGTVNFTEITEPPSSQFEVQCTLSDSAPSTTSDQETYMGVADFMGTLAGENTHSITMNDAVSTTAPSTAQIACSDLEHNATAYKLTANSATLTAVQTTQNS
jgi:hypothetical protein